MVGRHPVGLPQARTPLHFVSSSFSGRCPQGVHYTQHPAGGILKLNLSGSDTNRHAMPLYDRMREHYRRLRGRRATTKSSTPQSDYAPPVEHGPIKASTNPAHPESGLIKFAPPEYAEPTDCVHPEPDPIGRAPAQDPPTCLWDRAYKALGENEPKLVEKYEDLLFDELETIGVCSPPLPPSLLCGR